MSRYFGSVRWLVVWLGAVCPVAAEPMTQADSQESAIVMSFRRLCVDVFPSIDTFEEMGRKLKWQRTQDLATAVACVGSGGKVDQVINPFLTTDFGFPVNLSVLEVGEGADKITTCAVGHPGANPEAVIAGMRKDVGLDQGGIFPDPAGGIQETWAIGRLGEPHRITAFYDQGPGIVLQLCDDSTGIKPVAN